MKDLISRQAWIDALEWKWAGKAAIDAIKNLPSAQPERKNGEWIDCDTSEHWKCNQCGCRAGFWFNEENSSDWEKDMSEWLSDYCPNCGAEMRGEQDEAD